MTTLKRFLCAKRLGTHFVERGLKTSVGEQRTKRYCHVVFHDMDYLYNPNKPNDDSKVYGVIQIFSITEFTVASNQHGTAHFTSEEEVKAYLSRCWP